MIVVIIAGGSGTRLWPLSTSDYPKHLLTLTNERSLLQNTVDRVKKITDLSKIFVVSEVSHIDHIYKQLKDLDKKNILVEPCRRGTASCVIYALSEIKKRGLDGEPVLFLWADHLIRDSEAFVFIAKRSGKITQKAGKLVFIGVEPTYPSTGFGYMERDGEIKNCVGAYKLASFKEKPDKATAKKYFEKGNYLWNTGYLAGQVKTFEREIKSKNKRLWNDYNKLLKSKDINKIYTGFESQPIDTALSEKIEDGIVLPGSFDWVDVGSFHDLHQVSGCDEEGNHIKGESVVLDTTTNSYVRNETKTPVAVIGLDNVAVVINENGILVTNKSHAQKVGEVSKRFGKKGKI